MQGLIRIFLLGRRRGQGQIPLDKVASARPICGSNPDEQQMLELLKDSCDSSRSPLYKYRCDDETRMHDSPTGGPVNGMVSNGHSFRFALESVHTPNRFTFRNQRLDEMIATAHALRNLGRKYLKRSKRYEDASSDLHKLGRQAWHVGTTMLIVDRDLKARMCLLKSTRLLAARLMTILQQLHPNAEQNAHLRAESITADNCDDTKKKQKKTAEEIEQIKRKQRMRRKRKRKLKQSNPSTFSDQSSLVRVE